MKRSTVEGTHQNRRNNIVFQKRLAGARQRKYATLSRYPSVNQAFLNNQHPNSSCPNETTNLLCIAVAAAPNVSATATTRRALYSPRFLQQVVDSSSSSTSPASQDELSWLFGAGQFTPATSLSPTSGSNKRGPIAPEYGALHYGVTT